MGVVRARASIPIALRTSEDRLAATDNAGLMGMISGADDDPVLDALVASKCHLEMNLPSLRESHSLIRWCLLNETVLILASPPQLDNAIFEPCHKSLGRSLVCFSNSPRRLATEEKTYSDISHC